MHISKVRLKRSSVSIDYTTENESRSVVSKDAPLPEFKAAVAALTPLILDILHLPEDYAQGIVPLGLTMADKQGVSLVTIVAMKDLPECHSPFNIATPLRFMEHPAEEGTYSPALTEAQKCVINEVIAQAVSYVAGKRAQGSLPLEDADDEAEDDKFEGDDVPDNVLDLPGAEETTAQKKSKKAK